jgi:hypothetical protein
VIFALLPATRRRADQKAKITARTTAVLNFRTT